ncbi:MAG: PAS domain-containing protein [bacterium]|nr:PAS domain-containing protein [bacterium]
MDKAKFPKSDKKELGAIQLSKELEDMHVEDIRKLLYELAISNGQLQSEIDRLVHKTAALNNDNELQQDQKYLFDVINNIWEYIYIVEYNNGLPATTFNNQRCKDITGYSSEEYTKDSRLWMKMIHKDDMQKVEEFIKNLRSSGGPKTIEHRLIHKNGSIRWVSNTSIIRKINEKTTREYGFILDITGRKEREEENRKRLLDSEKLANLGSLVAGSTHEINTPLGLGITAASHCTYTIGEFQKMLQSENIKRSHLDDFLETLTETSHILLKNLNRTADLVRSLKNVAVDQCSEEKRKFNLKEYIDDILLSLRPKLKKTGHTVTVNCPVTIELYSYPGVFSQVLSNLIINSLVHGFEGIEQGLITIDITQTITTLVIRYTDNGNGIKAEHLSKIFTPFFTTKRDQGGSGLGLHIIHKLVTGTLKGEIDCTSSSPGVCFSIKIPVQ